MLLINSVGVETASAGTRAPAVNLTNFKLYPSVAFKYSLDKPLIINVNLFIAIRQTRAVKVFFNIRVKLSVSRSIFSTRKRPIPSSKNLSSMIFTNSVMSQASVMNFL